MHSSYAEFDAIFGLSRFLCFLFSVSAMHIIAFIAGRYDLCGANKHWTRDRFLDAAKRDELHSSSANELKTRIDTKLLDYFYFYLRTRRFCRLSEIIIPIRKRHI